MKRYLLPKYCFWICNGVGFGLLFAFWFSNNETAGFFLILFLVTMALLRWRFPRLHFSLALDAVLCIALSGQWIYAPFALALPLFASMYFGFYWMVLAIVYLLIDYSSTLFFELAFSVVSGLFLRFWEKERLEKIALRDSLTGRYYEMEDLQNELTEALAQVERMTAVSERTRIARDIHDNAGHEIIAAYISFQTIRELLAQSHDSIFPSSKINSVDNPELLDLYDDTLARLDKGVTRIREVVHNLSAVAVLGVEHLEEICKRFPLCEVEFHAYGDTSNISMYVWNMLESCLNESLTNVAKHSAPTYVSVHLDKTPYIIQLRVENDGGRDKKDTPIGSGLRSLRQRAAAIGGNLSVDAGEIFRIVCVIPVKDVAEEKNEFANRR